MGYLNDNLMILLMRLGGLAPSLKNTGSVELTFHRLALAHMLTILVMGGGGYYDMESFYQI